MTTLGYFDRKEMSNSKLTAWKYELERGAREGVSFFSDRAKDLGHLFHANLFEPHLYQQVLLECKSEITKKDLKLLRDMRTAALNFRSLRVFLEDLRTLFEQEYFGQLCGLDFKMKADAINEHMQAIGDAKSTAATTLQKFLESCDNYGYWRQAYIYMMLTGMTNFYFWGVSKVKPHNVFFVDVSQYPMEMANAAAEVTWLCEEYIKAQEEKVKNAAFRERVFQILESIKD